MSVTNKSTNCDAACSIRSADIDIVALVLVLVLLGRQSSSMQGLVARAGGTDVIMYGARCG